jgi:hypothetical protein
LELLTAYREDLAGSSSLSRHQLWAIILRIHHKAWLHPLIFDFYFFAMYPNQLASAIDWVHRGHKQQKEFRNVMGQTALKPWSIVPDAHDKTVSGFDAIDRYAFRGKRSLELYALPLRSKCWITDRLHLRQSML